MKRVGSLMLAALVSLPAGAGADAEYFPAAAEFAPSLALPPCPQAAGMGGAYSAVAEGATALAWNPAALDLIAEPQAVFMHNEWNASLGMRQEYLAYSQKSGLGGLGLALNYFNLGELETRDSNGGLTGFSQASDFSLSLGLGRSFFSPKLHLGLMPEIGLESAGGSSEASAGLSMGGLYELGNLALGVSLMHAGLGPGGSHLPTVLRTGLAWRIQGPGLLIAADASGLFDSAPALSAGLQWSAGHALKVRLGWRQQLASQLEDAQSGPAAGLGFKVSMLEFNYAFVPQGPFPAAQRLSVTLGLGGELFRPKLVIQKDPALEEMVERKMKNGDRRFGEGDYKGAVAEWEVVLQLEPESKEAYRKIGEAKLRFNSELAATVSAAEAALKSGDLLAAVRKYRRALALEPGFGQAKQRLAELQPRLADEIIRLHRAGIDAYVRGDYLQALTLWKQGQELDSQDRLKFQRDIDRAKAGLNLQSQGPPEASAAPEGN